jgi:transcriptional regulator with XRE-family HTH domain
MRPDDLATFRKSLGLTQTQLGERLGLSWRAV